MAKPKSKVFNLEERTAQFAEKVIELVKKIPQNSINRSIIEQLVRSTGSIGANYCEANEAESKKISNIKSESVKRKPKKASIGLDY